MLGIGDNWLEEVSNADWYARRVAPGSSSSNSRRRCRSARRRLTHPQPGPAVMPGNYLAPQGPMPYPQQQGAPAGYYPPPPQATHRRYPPQMQNFSNRRSRRRALRQAVFSGTWQGTNAARQGTHHRPNRGGPTSWSATATAACRPGCVASTAAPPAVLRLRIHRPDPHAKVINQPGHKEPDV